MLNREKGNAWETERKAPHSTSLRCQTRGLISHNLAVFPLSEVTLRDNSPSRAVMECTEIRETCETCET